MSALGRLPLVAVLAAVTSLSALAPRPARAGETTRVRDARAHYEQAVSYYNLDEFTPALAEFREAYRLKPDPSFLFNIAQCHRKLGETDAALDFYRKYLRSLPDASNRADVERMIAELRARQTGAAPATAAPAPSPEPPILAPSAPPPAAPPPPAPPAAAPSPPAPMPAATADALVTSQAPAASPPIYRRWWFWTAVGAVVAGAIIGGYAASRPDPSLTRER